MSAKKDELVLTRTLRAPIEKVWRAWSEQESLRAWWGQPKNATMPVCTVDFRVGGVMHAQVVITGGPTLWIKAVYTEITPMTKIAFDDLFSDEAGNTVINDEFPQMHVEATFVAQGAYTEMTVRHSGIAAGRASIEEYEQGWSETLERLENILS